MADSRWVSTNGNMSTAASYSPSGVPADVGTIFFDGSSQQDVLTGWTAFAAYNGLARIWVQPDYQGNFGADGNAFYAPLRRFIHNGSGSVYDHHAVCSPAASYTVIDSPNQQDAYTLSDTDGAAGIDWTLACINGGVKILDNNTIVIGTLLIGSRGGFNVPRVDIGVISSNVNYRQSSGYVTTKSPLGSNLATSRSVIDGGTLVYDALGTAGWSNVEISGGTMQYNGTGTMVFCIVNSGTLDMTGDSRAKTITKLIVMPGGNFLTHSNITVTTLIDLRGSYPILP